MQLARPGSGLQVRVVSEKGEPLAGRQLLLRINGELIPPAVILVLGIERGEPYATGSDGVLFVPGLPRGSCEIWTFRGEDDYLRLLRTLPDRDEATVTIGDGLARATITAR
jgi:hypothetical protein